MAGRGHLRLRALGWRLRRCCVTGGRGRGERGKQLLCVGGGVRGGQGMERPEVGRVLEGLGMRRELEGSGGEDGLRAVGEATESGSGGGGVWRGQEATVGGGRGALVGGPGKK